MQIKRGLGTLAACTALAAAITSVSISSAGSERSSTSAGTTQASGASTLGGSTKLAAGSTELATESAFAPSRPDAGLLPRSRRVFPGKVLVAYYGTAQTGALGVLGETNPKAMTRRLRDAARPYGAEGKKVKIVYELIVSVADATAGSDGDYSHLIPKSYVKKYIRAARRHHAYLVMDFQPGRASFLSQVRQLRWALKKPFVGVALDPEWRMGPGEVPGQTIGSVKAAEVNRVSRYVARLTRHQHLRQKLFLLHQFRTDMVEHIGRVRRHKQLAMVQHADGFGTQGQKLDTYRAIAKPRAFQMGFKLFYDEDTDLFRPREVLRIRPEVRFISYQ